MTYEDCGSFSRSMKRLAYSGAPRAPNRIPETMLLSKLPKVKKKHCGLGKSMPLRWYSYHCAMLLRVWDVYWRAETQWVATLCPPVRPPGEGSSPAMLYTHSVQSRHEVWVYHLLRVYARVERLLCHKKTGTPGTHRGARNEYCVTTSAFRGVRVRQQ